MMELFILAGCVAFIWFLNNRVKAAMLQAQKEEFVREVVRKTVQKRRIDQLYGRDRERD